MDVINGIGNAKNRFHNAVLVIGIFDGLHIGHQKLITQAVNRALELKTKAVVLTFSPHPMRVLHPEYHFKKISSLPYRLKLLDQFGVGAVVVAKFSKRFAQMSPERFAKNYLRGALNATEVFVGDDFRFGMERQGTIARFGELAKRLGFTLRIVPQVLQGFEKISSTLIRRMIEGGELALAEKWLGRRFGIMGLVEHGDGRGQKLGFPTINVYPDPLQILPPQGVYAVYVEVNKKIYAGVANLGFRKTFHTSRPGVNLEAYLFDFHKNIYGKDVVVQFVEKIRDELKFDSVSALSAQMKKDVKRARSITGNLLLNNNNMLFRFDK
ncbi:MAG: bifunctional riboflavin kinase/FAD synthetase [Candidatus Omnitrophica bacterium]|nr:bifunctional riboflavin kinase/FAD synthetase [Candidatus Omnitrophota bacterium]